MLPNPCVFMEMIYYINPTQWHKVTDRTVYIDDLVIKTEATTNVSSATVNGDFATDGSNGLTLSAFCEYLHKS